MVQAFASYRADYAFDIGALPRRSRSAKHFLDIHNFDLFAELLPVNAIAISEQIFRRSVERKRFEHLLRCPFSGGMRGDAEVDNTSAMVSENDKDEQNFKPDGVDREEVN